MTPEQAEARARLLAAEVLVLRDLLDRAAWYTGRRKEAGPSPTEQELRFFRDEIHATLERGDDE